MGANLSQRGFGHAAWDAFLFLPPKLRVVLAINHSVFVMFMKWHEIYRDYLHPTNEAMKDK